MHQLFGLSFWRHPFTAESANLFRWRNKLIRFGWREGVSTCSAIFHFWVNYSFNYQDWKSLKQFEWYWVSSFLSRTFLNTSDSADKGPEEHLVSGLESAPQSSTARKWQTKHKLFIWGLPNKLRIQNVPELLTVTEEQVTMYMAKTSKQQKQNISVFQQPFSISGLRYSRRVQYPALPTFLKRITTSDALIYVLSVLKAMANTTLFAYSAVWRNTGSRLNMLAQI